MTTALLLTVVTLTAQAATLSRPVTYLPQTEALCGGAAAAMVMRYWGDTAITPEAFAPLIVPELEGIVTTTLIDDLRSRDWQAFPLRGDDTLEAVALHLRRGRPVIALIEDRPDRYHYVVVTSLDDTAVRFHDPAIAPNQSMKRDAFARRWRAANFWMLLLLPASEPGTGAGTEPAEPTEPMEPPLASDVAALLSSGNLKEALRLSRDATIRDPRDGTAWDALATTLFVMDRPNDALDAWNRTGKPQVDTVQIAGLAHTRYRAAERTIGITSGEVLTARALSRARQRLRMLPSAAASRVSYAPLADGRVQIDAAVAEHTRLPGGFDLLGSAVRAPFTRSVDLAFTNLVGGGERVAMTWRFREGFERIDVGVEAPAPLPIGALWKVSGFNSRETYDLGQSRVEHQWTRAAFQTSDWLTGSMGWTLGAGFERWPSVDGTRDDKAWVGGRLLVAMGATFDGHVTLEGWMGGAGATRASTMGRLRFPTLGGHTTLVGGMEGVHANTPPFLLAGAGAGHTRTPLLRAHPLIVDDAIGTGNGRIFARRLFYGTAEWRHRVARLLVATIDAAAFVDVAHGRQLLGGRPRDTQIDAGLGIRLGSGAGPALRIDVARGLRDRQWAVTAGTVIDMSQWIF